MSCIIKYKGQSIPEEQFLQYLNKQIASNNLFNEDETLANSVYEALGFKTIPSDISKIKDFEGTIIEYIEHIGTHKDGRSIGARNINKGEKIQVVLSEMRKKFEEKSWINPVNSEPLPQDTFSSFEELMMFMYLHEKAHEYILQEEGESLKSYETRVNNEALKRLNAEFKITQQQKQKALQLYSQYLEQNPNGSIEGFKNFVENDASFSVKRKTYQESLNTLEIYGHFQENGFSKEGVKKDMLPQVKRHLGTLSDIVDIKVASNEQLYLTYQGKKITFGDLKTIVKNLSPNTQEYRGLNIEDVEYLQDNKDIFLRVLHENKRERAWDITSDFIVNNLEAIVNNPNTFFNQSFKNKDVINYKEMSDVFKGSHVVAKVVEKYSKFLETYTVKRHFDKTEEEDVRTGLGVFNVLSDKMVVSELNIFINVFLKKSYYNAYASFFNTVEEKKDFTKAFIKDVNREALETFAHESVHLVVGKQLRHDILQEEQNKEVSQEYSDLKALMEHSLRYLPHLKDIHGFSDIQEFVAVALTDGSFKKALLGVPASTEVNVSKYPPINFFKQLLDALVKYLSLSNITTFEESVLKQIMIVTDSLAEKSFENNLPSKINDLIALLEPTLEGVQSLENTGLINKMC